MIKTSVDPSTALVQCHGGPLVLVGLLNSHFSPVTPRSYAVGQCFSDTSLNKLYFRKPQENPPNWYSKRMWLYPEASPKKKRRLGSIIYLSVVLIFPSIDEQTETQRHWIVCPRGLCCGERAISHAQMCLIKKAMSFHLLGWVSHSITVSQFSSWSNEINASLVRLLVGLYKLLKWPPKHRTRLWNIRSLSFSL